MKALFLLLVSAFNAGLAAIPYNPIRPLSVFLAVFLLGAAIMEDQK